MGKKTSGFTPLEKGRRRRPTVAFGNLSLTGFTLIEIMVVVVIIGILAALAIPNYVNTREKALDKEAVAGVKLIRAADRQYYVQNETYFPFARFVVGCWYSARRLSCRPPRKLGRCRPCQ